MEEKSVSVEENDVEMDDVDAKEADTSENDGKSKPPVGDTINPPNYSEDVEMIDAEPTEKTNVENGEKAKPPNKITVEPPTQMKDVAEKNEGVEMVNEESAEAEKNEEDLELPEGVTIDPPPQVFGVGNEGDPRLIITHIVNINFKSYSGKTVLGPFHKSFTSIIGPNGSGKSNVIDSMLFVFGFRANKIRSTKLSVLIHNSKNHNSATSCTVEVHFEKITDLDDGGYCTVPGSSFFVSRTAKKDNSSQYYINDRRAQFKEVASFLQICGIDLNHNRFLILQGEVEQISQMKPKSLTDHDEGMLEYLEDIIGSSRFKGAIEKMNGMIDELNEDRKDKLARVKIVQKDKDDLEEVKNKAVEYLNKKNDKISLLNEIYQFYIYNITKVIDGNEKEINEMKSGMKSFEDNIKVIENDKKAKNKECAKISKELEKIEASHIEKKDEMRELENKNVKVFEDKKHQKLQGKQLKKKIEKEKTKLSQLEFAPETMQEEMDELNVRKEEVAQEKSDAEKALNNAMLNLKEETQTLQEEKEELEKVLLEKMKYVNESKSKKDMAETELNLFQEKLNSAKHNVERCKTQITNSAEARQNAADKLSSITSEYPALKMQHSEVTENLRTLRKKESRLKNELHENQTTLSEARQSAQQNKSQSSVLKFLMDLKRSRNVDGIYGRLGDLGVIEERYDVAISSCCGALENIVVDNIFTAEKCIKALKQNDVGQATFVALDKMERHRQAAQKQNTPLDRLVDLIEVKEERFRVAFYHALRDTLVANNLEIATKVAYSKQKRWKVVTLKGEVVDTSGTMTGGGTRVMKGRMSSNYKTPEISHEDLTKLQSVCSQYEGDLKKVQEEIVQLEAQINTLGEQLERISSERQLLEQEIRCQEITSRDCQQRLPQLEKALKEAKPDPVKLKLLSDKLASATKDYDAGSSKTKAIEAKKDVIHAKICEINEKKLKPYKTHLESLKKCLNETLKKIPKLKVAMTTSKRNFVKCKTNIEMFESELTENAGLIAKLEEEWKVLETVGAKVYEAMEAAKEEKLQSSQKLEEIQTEVKRIEQKHSKELQAFALQRKDLQVVQEANDKHKVNIVDWNDKLSKLKYHDVDGNQTESLHAFNPEQLEVVNVNNIKDRITIIDEEIDQMNPNMRAIKEYREKEKIYLNRVSEFEAVTEKRNKYRNMHNALRKTRLHEFTEGFTVITDKLKEIYQMITLGGDAELEFVDSLDPFSEGIVFSVRPPKKSWKSICHLSGGEKTLSSLALVFALHHYRPTPLYVMDEIDAALDFKNVTIIAHYIVERTKNAQFIIISLRNNMFEVADRLVGIYKTDNCTKSCTIEPKLIAQAQC